MSADARTVALYDARVDDYTRLVTGDAPSPALEAFVDALPAGATVLDLGCGPGQAAARMAARGLQVDAVDASAEMVLAVQQTYGIKARQARFDQIGGQNIYAGIWANFSLLHAPKSEFPAHLAALHRAVVPGGLFHIGMKTGQGEARDALGRFYAYYTESELVAHLEDAGFTVTSRTFGNDRGLEGTIAPWITLTAHG